MNLFCFFNRTAVCLCVFTQWNLLFSPQLHIWAVLGVIYFFFLTDGFVWILICHLVCICVMCWWKFTDNQWHLLAKWKNPTWKTPCSRQKHFFLNISIFNIFFFLTKTGLTISKEDTDVGASRYHGTKCQLLRSTHGEASQPQQICAGVSDL